MERRSVDFGSSERLPVGFGAVVVGGTSGTKCFQSLMKAENIGTERRERGSHRSDGGLQLECYSVISHPEKRCLEKLKLSGEIRPVCAHVLVSTLDLCVKTLGLPSASSSVWLFCFAFTATFTFETSGAQIRD